MESECKEELVKAEELRAKQVREAKATITQNLAKAQNAKEEYESNISNLEDKFKAIKIVNEGLVKEINKLKEEINRLEKIQIQLEEDYQKQLKDQIEQHQSQLKK